MAHLYLTSYHGNPVILSFFLNLLGADNIITKIIDFSVAEVIGII